MPKERKLNKILVHQLCYNKNVFIQLRKHSPTKKVRTINILLELSAHDPSASFMAEFVDILSSPAHWAFELLFSILFDVIVISLFYGILVKRVIIPRLKKTLHEEIDKEHGIPPHD